MRFDQLRDAPAIESKTERPRRDGETRGRRIERHRLGIDAERQDRRDHRRQRAIVDHHVGAGQGGAIAGEKCSARRVLDEPDLPGFTVVRAPEYWMWRISPAPRNRTATPAGELVFGSPVYSSGFT
jgi:hypothetical protein